MRPVALLMFCVACGGAPFEPGDPDPASVPEEAGSTADAKILLGAPDANPLDTLGTYPDLDAGVEAAETPAQALILAVTPDTSHCVSSSAPPSTNCGGAEPFTVLVGNTFVPCASIQAPYEGGLVQCPIGSACLYYPSAGGGSCEP